MTTTNNKRVTLRKKGEPISKLAKSNYPLWKLATESSLDELSMLMTKRKYDLKYEDNDVKNRSLRREILLLNDAYKIKKRMNLEFINKGDIIDVDTSEDLTPINIMASDIISKLNYNQNTLYREEVIKISNKIDDIYCSNEVLATCIVKCVLDKYNSKYDEIELLKIYEIPEVLFYRHFTTVSLWCRKNYWKR